jgi:hypothetical protein
MIRVIEEMITEFTRSTTEMKEKLNIEITDREEINMRIDTDLIETEDNTMNETYIIQMKDSHVIVEIMTEENIDIRETTDMIDRMIRKTYKNRDKETLIIKEENGETEIVKGQIHNITEKKKKHKEKQRVIQMKREWI